MRFNWNFQTSYHDELLEEWKNEHGELEKIQRLKIAKVEEGESINVLNKQIEEKIEKCSV